MKEIRHKRKIGGRYIHVSSFAYRKHEYDGEYISKEEYRDKIYDIKEGDHVETMDDWIVPCIYSNDTYVRFLNEKNIVFRHMRKWVDIYGGYVKFYLGKPGVKTRDISTKQSLFAYYLYSTGNMIEACEKAGYSIRHGFTLLDDDGIRKQIVIGLKLYMEANDITKEDVFVNRYNKMMDTLQKGLESTIEKDPAAAAKLAEVMTKSITDMGKLLKEEHTGIGQMNLPPAYERPKQLMERVVDVQ